MILDLTRPVRRYRIPGGLEVEVPGTPTIDALGRASVTFSVDLVDPITAHVISTAELVRLQLDGRREHIKFYVLEADATTLAQKSIVRYRSARYEIRTVANHVTQGGVFIAHGELIEATL